MNRTVTRVVLGVGLWASGCGGGVCDVSAPQAGSAVYRATGAVDITLPRPSLSCVRDAQGALQCAGGGVVLGLRPAGPLFTAGQTPRQGSAFQLDSVQVNGAAPDPGPWTGDLALTITMATGPDSGFATLGGRTCSGRAAIAYNAVPVTVPRP